MATRTAIDQADIVQGDPQDETILRALGQALMARPELKPQLVGPDDAPLDLPMSLYTVLRDAVDILLTGQAVAISSVERRLSTTEAGDLLGVSRQYLTRLIDEGQLACEFTGRHRRIRLKDLLEYKRARDDQRMAVLNELTAEAAAAGEYD